MKIAILGAGKMGAWLARRLAEENDVAVYDTDPPKAAAVSGVRVLGYLQELATFKPQLLLNAVSLQHTLPAFEQVLPYLPKDCLLADVASVKGELPAYYQKSGFRFVSVHPMFGPTFANLDSLKEENAVLIQESDPGGKAFFRTFFTRLGLRIFEYSFKEHDERMAYSLTTPFAASLVFAACVDATTVPGTTFKKHIQIARGVLSEDDHLLAEILFAPSSLRQLEKITARLEFLKHVIKARDHGEAKKFFDRLRKNIGK